MKRLFLAIAIVFLVSTVFAVDPPGTKIPLSLVVGAGKTKTVIDSTELKRIKEIDEKVSIADLVTPTSFDTVLVTAKATAPTMPAGTNTTDVASTAYVQNESSKYLRELKALGFANWKIFPIGMFALNAGATLTDNTAIHACFEVRVTTTYTTVNCVMSTKGDYTADNYNGFGLYSLNLSDGTMTKITETADDGNIWKANTNTIISKSWPTPQALSPGIYVIKALYNNSAQVTAPALLTCSYGISGALTPLFPNGIKLIGQKGSTNTLPTSEAMSTVSAGQNMLGIWMN